MKFSEALKARKPIPKLGHTRLRFEVEMLVGEQVRPLRLGQYIPELALVAAVALAIGCAVVALQPGAPGAVILPLGLLAGATALAGLRLEIGKRARRGFVLHFATRTLRIDRPARFTGRTETLLFEFKDVREAGVTEPRPGHYALEVELPPVKPDGPPRVEVLIPEVPKREVEDLFRVSDLTRAAVGLIPPEE